jgi:hypothetical protein
MWELTRKQQSEPCLFSVKQTHDLSMVNDRTWTTWVNKQWNFKETADATLSLNGEDSR